ncbi:PKD domain-containing protein [Thermococcus sp.]
MKNSSTRWFGVLVVCVLMLQFPLASAISLPHSVFRGEKRTIDTEDNIVPAYVTQPKYREEDLRKEIELKYSYNLDEFIELLNNDPIEIFWYIRNNFDYEPYYGSLKGPIGTFLQRGGNDLDLANLLVEIYRQLGIPARYVRGNIIMSEAQLKKWFGLEEVERVLKAGHIPYEKTSDEYIIEHFWVEAYIDGKWVPLDPSFKEYEYVPPQLELSSLGRELVGSVSNSSVIGEEKFLLRKDVEASPVLSEETLQNISQSIIEKLGVKYIGNTSNQSIYKILKGLSGYENAVFGAWKIIKSRENFGKIPFKVNNVLEEFSQIPLKFRYKTEIHLQGYNLSATLLLANVSVKRVTLGWLPATESDLTKIRGYEDLTQIPVDSVNVTPVLMVDGVPIALGRTSHLGEKTNLTVAMTLGDETLYNESTSVTIGGYYAISINSFRVSQQFMNYRLNRLRITNFMVDKGFSNITSDEVLGEMLNLAGLSYWYKLDEYADEVAASLEMRWLRIPSVIVLGTAYKIEDNKLKFIGMFVDVQKDLYLPLAQDGNKTKEKAFMMLTGRKGSELEAQVLRQYFNAPAISTATIFDLAYELDIPIYHVDSSNVNTVLPLLNISQEDKDRILGYVNEGYEVYVPGSNVTINGWVGTGYYVVDPETGAMAYMISGGIRGGLSFLEWIHALMQEGAIKLFENLGFMTRMGEELAEKVSGVVSVFVSAVLATVEAVASCLEVHPCECSQYIKQKIVSVTVDGVLVTLTISIGLSAAIGSLSFGLGLVASAGVATASYLIGDITKSLINWFLGFSNTLRNCPAPDVVIRQPRRLIKVSKQVLDYVEAFSICVVSRNGLRAYRRVHWEIPIDNHVTLIQHGIRGIRTRDGTIYSSSKYQCDPVYVMIDPKYVPMDIKLKGGIVEVPVQVNIEMETFKGTKTSTKTGYIRYKYEAKKYDWIQVLGLSQWISYQEGGSAQAYFTFLNRADKPAKIFVKTKDIEGLKVEYPKKVPPQSQFTVKVTSSGLSKGKYSGTIIVTGEFSIDEWGYKEDSAFAFLHITVTDKNGKSPGREDGHEGLGNPGNDHPDDTFDVPGITLTREADFYTLLREGLKKNITESADLLSLASYHAYLYGLTASNLSIYRESAENMARLYIRLSSNLRFLNELIEKAPSVAVFRRGFYSGMENLLRKIKVPYRLVDESFDPTELAEYQHVLILPSGSLFGMDTPLFREKLRLYLENGGNIIVFDQQYGEHFSVIPGGLDGYGWAQDQMCHGNSLYAAQDHPILSTVRSNTITEEVDGYFEKYPPDSVILMRRTKNDFPAMLLYSYGKGHVLATTLYSDWKSQKYVSGFMANILRDAINYFELHGDVYEIGVKRAWYGYYYPNATYTVPINITNPTNTTAEAIKFRILTPEGKINSEILLNETLSPGETKTLYLGISQKDIKPITLGIWTVDYVLLSGGKEIYTRYDMKGISVNIYYDSDEYFNYKGGSKYLVWTTSEKENLLFGEKTKIIFHVINKDSKTLTGQLGIGHHIGGWHVLEVKNISVAPGEYKKYEFEVYPYADSHGEPGLTYYMGLYTDKSPYDGSVNFWDAKLTAEKGVHVRYPNIRLIFSVDKTKYAPGETIHAQVNITNNDDVNWNLLLVGSIYYERDVVENFTQPVTIPRLSSISVPVSIKMPKNAKPGYYLLSITLSDVYKKSIGGFWRLPYYNTGFTRENSEVELNAEVVKPLGVSIRARIVNDIPLVEPKLRVAEYQWWNGGYAANISTFNMTFTNWESEVYIPISGDIFGRYSVSYTLYDGITPIASGSVYLDRKVLITPEVLFSGRVFSNMTLLVHLRNPGFLEENFNLNITIPALNYTAIIPIKMAPEENRTVNITGYVPYISPGAYQIYIRAMKEKGAVESYSWFRIRGSEVVGEIHTGPYSVGEEANATLENRGGVPANVTGNLSIVCEESVVSSRNFSLILNPGEKTLIKVPIPENATRRCVLALSFTDLSANRTKRLTWPLWLRGLKIQAIHANESYAGDTITVTLKNVGGIKDTVNITISLRQSLWRSALRQQEYHNITLAPGESVNVTFEVPNIPSGRYVFYVFAAGSEYWDYLNVIGLNLSVHVSKTSYKAGENITAMISNSGGGHANLTVTAYLRSNSTMWSLGRASVEIGKLEDREVNFTIPRNIPTGNYTLIIRHNFGAYSRDITVKGLELSVDLLKRYYDVDENVQILINNTGGTDANLEVKYGISYYHGVINVTVPVGSSRIIEVDIPDSLPTGTYNLWVSIYDRFTGLSIEKTFYITVRGAELEIVPIKTNLEPGEDLSVMFRNSGGIELDLNATLSIDGSKVSQQFILPKDRNLTRTFSLPPLKSGEYQAEITAIDKNSGRRFVRVIPISISSFRINATLNKESFAIGDELVVALKSSTNANAILDYMLDMIDEEGNTFHITDGSLVLPAMGTSSITATVGKVARGNYTLILRMKERNTGNKFVITWVIYIDGAWGQISVEMPSAAFVGQLPVTVNVTGNTNGTLRVIGNASLESYPTKLIGIEDGDGVWIAFSTHLGYYHDGKLTLFKYPNRTTIEGGYEGAPAAITSSEDRIWIASWDKILEFNKNTHKWRIFRTEEIPGFPARVSWQWGEEGVSIFTLAYYNSSLWVGTDTAGLVRIDPDTMTTLAVYNSTNSPLTADYIMMLKVNGSDLWVLSYELWKIGNGWTHYSPEDFSMEWIDAFEVFDNQIWVGGGNESEIFVCMLGGECLRDLPSWRVSNIEHDNESIWIVYPPWDQITVSRYYPTNGTRIDYSKNTFWGGLVEVEGNVYASSYGILIGDKLTRFGPAGYVGDIAYHDGIAYMLTESGLLSVYNLSSGEWKYIGNEMFSSSDRIVYADGRLFMTIWSGLIEYDLSNGEAVIYNSSNSPFSSLRNPISLAGSDKLLYVGTSDGLVVLNLTTGNFTIYYPPDFGGTAVRDVYLNEDELWIAGDNGVGIYNISSNTYRPYLSGVSSWLVRVYGDDVWVAFYQGSDYALWHYNRESEMSEIYNSTNGLTGGYIRDLAELDGLVFVTYDWGGNISVFDGSVWRTLHIPAHSVEPSEKEVLLGGDIFTIYSVDILEFPVSPGRNEFNITIRRPGESEYAFELMLGKQTLDEKLWRLRAYEHAISFDLITPKYLYKKGENASFEVIIRNDAPLDDTVEYRLSLGSSVYEGNITVGATKEAHLNFTVRAETSFNATLTVNGRSITVPISVVKPEGEITLSAPNVVGYNEPFNCTLRIINRGVVPLRLYVEFFGSRNVTIAPGDALILSEEMTVTSDITIKAVISGDLEGILEKNVTMGEKVRISFMNYTAMPGHLEIPFTVENYGILDSSFVLTVRNGNWSWSGNISVPTGVKLNLTLPINLKEGNYTFRYESKFGEGSFYVEVVRERLLLFQSFNGTSLTLNITNLGPADFTGTLRVESSILSNITNITVPAGSWKLLRFPVGELLPGMYNLTVQIERDGRAVFEDVLPVKAEPKIALSIDGINSEQKIGDRINATVRVRNTGTARARGLLVFEVPGIYQKEIQTEISVDKERVFNFTFSLPLDLPSRTLRASVRFGNVTAERIFRLRGVNLSVNLTTDKQWYYEDDNITATITLTNNEDITLRGNVTLLCGAFNSTESFELGKGEEKLSFTFQACSRIFYQVTLSTGRIIYINSRLVQIRERSAEVSLITDKDRYHIGDNMTVYIYSTKPVSVSLAVFDNLTLVNVTNNASLKFRIPDVESGTYKIYYSYGNETKSREFDVVSPTAKILNFELKKRLFEPGENVSFSVLVHADEDVVGKVVVWLYQGTSLIDYYSQPLNLIAGDNYVNVTTDITVPNMGSYTLLYAFYRGLNSTVIASGSQTLQTEGAMITSMTTDKEEYTEAENITLKLVITGTPGTYMLKIKGIREVLEKNITVDGTTEVNLTLPARYFDLKITAELLMGEYSTSKQIAVKVMNLPPVARFTVQGNMSVNSELTFDASWSTDPGEDSLTYSWDFGDGAVLTTSDPTVTHTYTQAGNYTVILTVSDGEGGIDMVSLVLEISEVGVIKNITVISRSEAFRKLTTLAQMWTAGYLYYRAEYEELIARAKELEVDNETLASITLLHEEAEILIAEGWRVRSIEEVIGVWRMGSIIPNIIKVRKAYLLEKEAVNKLRKLLRL